MEPRQGAGFEMQNPNLTMRAMIITLIIFGLIMVVAYFARQKITSWRTYAASSVRTLSAVDGPEPRRGARPMAVLASDEPIVACRMAACRD
jgi:hypothetical protein